MKRTILIVDDVRSNREILKSILGDDYQILEAADGKEALDIMMGKHQKISMVLLDIVMPVMDGYEVLYNILLRKAHGSTGFYRLFAGLC